MKRTLKFLICSVFLFLIQGVCIPGASAMFTDSGQSLGSSNSQDIALGDIDGDGSLDAFVANYNQANKVWLNDGIGVFTDSGQSLGSSLSRGVALGDIDNDEDLDAFVANRCQGNRVWLNDGNGVFTDSGQILGSSFSESVAFGDLDGDGYLDVFISNADNQANKVWLNNGIGVFTDSGQSLGTFESVGVALGDIDNDEDLDAFVANWNQANKVWLNDGSGMFTDSGQSLGSSFSQDVALGDIDGDGDLDAIVANAGNQANKVWLNNGSGIFTDSGQSLGMSSSYGLALGNIDNEGYLDAFVANYTQANKVWLNDSSGVLTVFGQSLGSSKSQDIALGDIDGDGDVDAIVANAGNQANKVWINHVCYISFSDIPEGYWAESYILRIACEEITTGCGGNNYCPEHNVTRAEMAAFLVRAVEGEPAIDYCGDIDPFDDVASTHWACKYIKRLSELEITMGCGEGNYCPTNNVTRAQMATFIIRAIHDEPFIYNSTPYFTDVADTHWAFTYIQKLKDENITQGCTLTTYCPNSNVTRAQMAAFLGRAFLELE